MGKDKRSSNVTLPIPVVDIHAEEPIQRGRIYGESASGLIRETLGFYRTLFGKYSGFPWDRIEELLAPYVKQAEAFAPDLIQEMQGIAQGAGLSFMEVFSLNARSEIMFDLNCNECTSFAALPGICKNGETLLGQNWDWMPQAESTQVILKIRGTADVPPMVTFTEAGQVAKIGMNGAGIGLAVNTLSPNVSRSGVPWILVARRILESARLTQAMGWITGSPGGHAMNFMIGHAKGEAVDVETGFEENNIFFPTAGFLAHTNHYIRPCRKFSDTKSCDPNPATFLRLRRIQRRLESASGHLDLPAAQEILKDHFDHPFSVCLHTGESFAPAMQTTKTCLSIVMDLTGRLICFTKGNPCENPSHLLDMNAFLDWDSPKGPPRQEPAVHLHQF